MDQDWPFWAEIGASLLVVLAWAIYSVVTAYQVTIQKRPIGWVRGTIVSLFFVGIVSAALQYDGGGLIARFTPVVTISVIVGVVVLVLRARRGEVGVTLGTGSVGRLSTPGGSRFRNPANDYVEEASNAGLWCLLFGCFYLAYKGAWMPAVLAFGLAFITFGISWLIFPFFARNLIRKAYLQRGWVEIA